MSNYIEWEKAYMDRTGEIPSREEVFLAGTQLGEQDGVRKCIEFLRVQATQRPGDVAYSLTQWLRDAADKLERAFPSCHKNTPKIMTEKKGTQDV